MTEARRLPDASCGVVAFDLMQTRQSGPSVICASKRGRDHITLIRDVPVDRPRLLIDLDDVQVQLNMF
jgi:hypothetical protein